MEGINPSAILRCLTSNELHVRWMFVYFKEQGSKNNFEEKEWI